MSLGNEAIRPRFCRGLIASLSKLIQVLFRFSEHLDEFGQRGKKPSPAPLARAGVFPHRLAKNQKHSLDRIFPTVGDDFRREFLDQFGPAGSVVQPGLAAEVGGGRSRAARSGVGGDVGVAVLQEGGPCGGVGRGARLRCRC